MTAQADQILDDNSSLPSLTDALIPVAFLVSMLSATAHVFGADAMGPNQLVLILSAAVASIIGKKNGMHWEEVEKAILRQIAVSMQPVLILLIVGAMIGSWILSGTVPTIIYYGVDLVSPSYFYISASLVCAILSFSIGSSWSVAGTLGIGLMGIAIAMDLSLPISAGAVISGAYFGDKLSPLSDTTNLAAAVTGNDLFEHIKHMLWTTVPSFIIALCLFFFLGLDNSSTVSIDEINKLQHSMAETFNVHLLALIPFLLMLLLAARKIPVLPALLCGTLVGALFAVLLQWDVVIKLANDQGLSDSASIFKGLMSAMFFGFHSETGNVSMDILLSKGGMESMLPTIALMITAMTFGGVMMGTGLLRRLLSTTLQRAKKTGDLVSTTVGTCVGTNILVADQYLSIIIPGQMFADAYKDQKLKPVNLSRTLEDSATLTSALVPWNTCGAYMTATLGVSTFMYAPFAFFNFLCPMIAVFYGYLNIALPTIED